MRTTFSVFSVATLSLFTVEVLAVISEGEQAYIDLLSAESALFFGDSFGAAMKVYARATFDRE